MDRADDRPKVSAGRPVGFSWAILPLRNPPSGSRCARSRSPLAAREPRSMRRTFHATPDPRHCRSPWMRGRVPRIRPVPPARKEANGKMGDSPRGSSARGRGQAMARDEPNGKMGKTRRASSEHRRARDEPNGKIGDLSRAEPRITCRRGTNPTERWASLSAMPRGVDRRGTDPTARREGSPGAAPRARDDPARSRPDRRPGAGPGGQDRGRRLTSRERDVDRRLNFATAGRLATPGGRARP